MQRSVLGLVLVVPLVMAAGAEPPRGVRSVRPKATHVVVTDADLEVGAEVPAEVTAGVPVAVKGGSATQTPSGKKVKVTVAGEVEVTGTLPGAMLGETLLRDADLYSPDGKQVIGKAHAGAFVQPRGKGGGKGQVSADTVGLVGARVALDATAIGPQTVDLVLPDTAGLRMAVASEDADLYATQELKGTPRAKIKKGAQLVLVEEVGQAAHVKTYGEYEIEAWTFSAKVGDAGSLATTDQANARPTPSHEVFTDTTLYLGSDGKKAIGTLRGGTLVGITQKPVGGLARVRTLGDVRVEGWVKMADLDELETSIWRDQ